MLSQAKIEHSMKEVLLLTTTSSPVPFSSCLSPKVLGTMLLLLFNPKIDLHAVGWS